MFLSAVEPLFSRRIRSRLTETAHRSSIDVFSVNLKSILHTPPMLNTTVLGLDPGKLIILLQTVFFFLYSSFKNVDCN